MNKIQIYETKPVINEQGKIIYEFNKFIYEDDFKLINVDFIKNQKDLDPEFNEIVNKNFFDLIGAKNEN